MGKSYDLTDTDNPVAYHGASKDYINSFDHLDAPATKRAYKTDFPAHSSGAKREKLNKGRYDYMPARIVNEAYARVAAFGAEKYEPWNWAKGLPTSQIANSLQNHLWAYMEGENTDPESNLSHLDHLLWNAVALLYNEYHRIEDDRFKNIPKHEEKSFTIAK